MPLSEKSRAILEAIAKGKSYEQILVQKPAWTYKDIFAAAVEALEELTPAPNRPQGKDYTIEAIAAEHTNANRKWDDYQDWRLSKLLEEGKSVDEIAKALERRPSTIRSRIEKLKLAEQ